MKTILGREVCFILLLILVSFALYPGAASAGWVSEGVSLPKRDIGLNSSRAIALEPATSYPHIVYGNDALHHAFFDGTDWQYETLDTIVSVGLVSAAIDSNNKMHISYYDATSADLKYITNLSGSWAGYTLDSTGDVGSYNSIALDSNNKVHISYYDATNKDLKYITNASGSWSIYTLDSAGDVGSYNSIALDSNNKVHISYVVYVSTSSQMLRYITNSPGFWLASNIETSFKSYTSSIATNSANKVHIAYTHYDGQFTYIRHATNASGSWSIEYVGNQADERETYGPSIDIGSGNAVHMVYRQSYGPGGTKYATNASGAWVSTSIYPGGTDTINNERGRGFSSLVLDASNNSHVSFFNTGDGRLNYATNVIVPWDISEIDRAVTYDPFVPSCIAVGPDNTTHMAKPTKQKTMVYAYKMSDSWTAELVEGAESAGDCHIAVDSGNNAHISYSDSTSSGVKYATNTSGGWAIETIESGTAGTIAVDANDRTHVIYRTSGKPKYATNASGSWIKELIDSNGEQPRTLRLDTNGKAHVVFTNTVTNIGIYYATNASGSWSSMFVHNNPNYNEFVLDSTNKIHAARGSLYNVYYATNASGIWIDEFASGGYKPWSWGYDDAGVTFTLSVDSKNKAHILYSWFITSSGTDGSVAEIVYTTNAYGFWLDIRSLPGDNGLCSKYVLNWSRCLIFRTYPVEMVMDSKDYIHYLVGLPTYGYGSHHNKFMHSAGHEHALFIKPDGSLWAWGRNNEGQLGDSTRTNSTTPVSIGADNDWSAVAAGWQHSLALKKNGTLWAWGDNNYSQLGDGTTTDRLSPVQIGSGTDWVQISAGGAHNLALKSNGTLWAWGLNAAGQIGDGTTTARLSPVQIGTDTNWRAISAGWEHSLAFKSNRDLYSWGWNSKGQLGDGTTINKATPLKIGTGFSPDIFAGWQHSMAVKTELYSIANRRLLYGWGYNEYGQLGDGTSTDRFTPTQIGSSIDWATVAAGGAHTLGLGTDGTLWAWGGNWQGQIGDGSVIMRTAPVKIGSDTDWVDITAGWEHSAGMKMDGSLYTWGWNAYGQLGNGTTTNRYYPEKVNFRPTANFTALPTYGCDTLTVNFTNTSTGGDGPLSYSWDFGYIYEWYPHVPDTSTAENPSYTYENPGSGTYSYSVTLTVTDADGDSDTITKNNYITVYGPPCRPNPVAAFSATPLSGATPLTVNFTDSSLKATGYTGGLSYQWDFDNNGTVDSTAQNPSYTYNSGGIYIVKLTVTQTDGKTDSEIKTDYITVWVGSLPAANFTATPTSGQIPLTVNFTNTTTGGDAPFTYEWDFDNDGIMDSTAENPSHTYTSTGSYTVTLKVTDVNGDSDTVTKQNYITPVAGSIPTANFTALPTYGCDTLTVNFTNTSTGGDGPLSYSWNFGYIYEWYPHAPDTSTAENPSYTYENPGSGTYYYSVTLTVTDADGDSDTLTKNNYITVYGPPCRRNPIAAFSATPLSGATPLTVNFTDSSLKATGYTGGLSYQWDFDNNGVVDSTMQNPSYTYSIGGTYTVKLTVTQTDGKTDSEIKTDYITVWVGSLPAANFTATPTGGQVPLTVNFTNTTTGGDAPFTYEWDFDNDGVIDSTAANPSHTYTRTGSYTVTLKVTDTDGDSDTVTKENYITPVAGSVPTANFTALPTYGCDLLTVNFTNTSAGGDGPLSYSWDFGYIYEWYPHVPDTSTAENPSYTYENPGSGTYSYSVTLTVTDADGDSDTITKNNYITVYGPPCDRYRTWIDGTSLYFYKLQEAVVAAPEGSIIKSKGITFNENIYLDMNKQVTIKGGYNVNYTGVTGKTTINGNVVISSGIVTLENLILQ